MSKSKNIGVVSYVLRLSMQDYDNVITYYNINNDADYPVRIFNSSKFEVFGFLPPGFFYSMPNNIQTDVFCNDKILRDVGELMFKKKDEYQDIYDFTSVGNSNYINSLPLPLSSEHEVDVFIQHNSITNNSNNISMQTNDYKSTLSANNDVTI